ncbi:Heat shock protein F84.1 [Serratia rubidaea]|uniref:Heat shock protein F84.1 n=1 Tax=Serratia rubidaea TaxID=61652 RepID=A0A4U9HEM2_SERRU|nr:Heat shock protein F84.1 [Serratia rubidaea]
MRLDRLTNKFQLALADAQSLALGTTTNLLNRYI